MLPYFVAFSLQGLGAASAPVACQHSLSRTFVGGTRRVQPEKGPGQAMEAKATSRGRSAAGLCVARGRLRYADHRSPISQRVAENPARHDRARLLSRAGYVVWGAMAALERANVAAV